MTDPPKTIEEARKTGYGRSDRRYKEGFCAYEVPVPPWYIDWHQCKRHNGHGINGLYCKQHAAMVERILKE